jgi:gliding motility-associated-like protein
MNLPPIAGGYTLVHQRCCRNNTITNVPNSGNFGNTYSVEIPPQGFDNNSSPAFTGVAPITICLNEPLSLSVAAADPDGDSLYYELCSIFAGGGQSGGFGCNAVIPNPSCPPPFTPVPFSPPFSATNPLPASPAFAIDPNTGIISGTPTTQGQYVVGICVSEYRGGLKLSTVRLDYQFNVTSCISNNTASMETPAQNPTMLCNGLTVQFKSTSAGASQFFWDFGVPGVTNDTSNLPNPVFTFPSLGSYTVTLIINKGSICTDTVQYTFVLDQLVQATIQWTGAPCFEVQGLVFEPLGTWPSTATFQWSFGPLATPQISLTQVSDSVSWSAPGTYPVGLTIFWDSCSATFTDQITISALITGVNAGPDQVVPEGTIVQLSATGGVTYYWWADGPVFFSNFFDAAPTVNVTRDTTEFVVEAEDNLGCKGRDTLMVFVVRDAVDDPQNLITPNGDGINDVLDLRAIKGNDACGLTVLNRWGKEVYQVDEYAHNWSGADEGGNALPDGTYYMILQCGTEVRLRHPITILNNP